MRLFKKILVANRGEIAARIFRACRELGIESVAIYSEADAGAAWVKSADYAYPLTGVTATDTYLNQQAIFDIVRQAGVDAIHPGYGFLSENATFATACKQHGVKFIGPSPNAMRLMGSKAESRRIAQEAGVPTTPGVDGAGKSDAELLVEAETLGYPVLIKASAGGGGKGMRVVESADAFLDNLQSARSEAQNSFGDDHILLERFFTDIHHVEIQVLGDEHGNVVHLFERECSIQRRHQKIIEETPAPCMTPSLREQMTSAAVALAQAVDYASAGTVEFMVTPDREFFFLEMNTRLQVEHPITEMVTGVDLAAWQIRIAMGEPLAFTQDELRQQGHSIECRLYAEDAANHFLPSIGDISCYRRPHGPNVRVDDGIATGSAVTPYYDPMLAKVITYGADRQEAIRKMVAALRDTAVLGVTTNIDYLLAILQHPRFINGDTPTNFLEREMPDWKSNAEVDSSVLAVLGALEALQERSTKKRIVQANGVSAEPWTQVGAWRNVV